MHQVLLYSVIFLSCVSFLLALIACARVGQIIKSTEGLDWSNVANITGDLATLKKTIQTLNNRMNGMHSPKVAEQELLMQLMSKQQNNQSNGRIQGG
jgi:hypothetical protein